MNHKRRYVDQSEWGRALERDWIHESVVSVVRGARQDRDASQKKVAGMMGWSKSVIVNFENFRRDFGVADFILLAEKYGTDPGDLFASIMFHLRQRRRLKDAQTQLARFRKEAKP